ncbi:DUF2878 domain-containing protein [Pseudomonas mosselii]|uniref:DUF2878 domain-containing protein n=1 Tax=Pseudomonas mosselii TaxID=78327 RepID=UPI001644867B|nr:DUF2878 domain-containing protein [Pseudomonas mosselii]MBC3455520.1 DUF2878 domain-containing protein [Pseudomonas mosselii]
MRRGWLIANALWLQAGWWLCVLGARWPWLLLVVPPVMVAHVFLCRDRAGEFRALLRVTLAGCLLDSLLGALGVFAFDSRPLPMWLAMLWLVLASGLRHSLAWAGWPFWRGALFGALGGSLAYLAGARLAQVDLPLGTVTTALLLAPIWALLLPSLVRLATWR